VETLLPFVLSVVSLVVTVLVTVVLGGLCWIPAYRFHRRRSERNQKISAIGKSLYIVPSVVVLWLGLYPVHPTPLASLGMTPLGWAITLATTTLVGLKYYKRGMRLERQSLWHWIRNWPGIAGPEPSTSAPESASILREPSVLIPLAAGLVSLGDLVAKLLGFFRQVEGASVVEFVLTLAALGACLHVLTASAEETSQLGVSKITARYPMHLRITSAVTATGMLFLWAIAAGTEPRSNLSIASSALPEPTGRQLTLTLVNRGNEVRILTGFEVETRTWMTFRCLSADFSIPAAGQYNLAFMLSEPLTKIAAVPQLQFQRDKPGTLAITLRPSALGACSDWWTADIRIAVIADDGRRSITDWFPIRKH
jgi:hypothetical protein